jgi:integrase
LIHPTTSLPNHAIESSSSQSEKDLVLEALASRAKLSFAIDSISTLSPDETLAAKRILQHGDEWGIWKTPRMWVPAGVKENTLSVDLRQRITSYLPKTLLARLNEDALQSTLDASVEKLTKYLLLLRMGPAGIGRSRFRSLDPNTVRELAYLYGPSLFAMAVAKSMAIGNIPTNAASELLSSLQMDDLSVLSPSVRKKVLRECERMRTLNMLELWSDVPGLSTISRADAMTGPEKKQDSPPKVDSHLPLPDDYIAELGHRSIWFMRDLAPNLFSIAQEFVRIWQLTDKPEWAVVTVRDARRDAVRDILAKHIWKDQAGKVFDAPPFPLRLPKEKGFMRTVKDEGGTADIRWPPRTYLDFMGLLGGLQMAHGTTVLLSMGSRQSEFLSLERNCVVRSKDGRLYANGKTFKLVQRHDGELRDWLMPDLAAEAIEQQLRLVDIGERIGALPPNRKSKLLPPIELTPTHLWAQLSAGAGASDSTLPLRDINKALVSYVRMLLMDRAPSGQNLRSHRFRKTIARLVALALTQAPKLLMDLFGHKSIEMTLYYILSDKDLRAEIETVSRELRVMRAKDVIEKMVDADVSAQTVDNAKMGGYGGLAAATVQDAIEVQKQRVHRRGDDWGADSVIELAELLTLQGQTWDQVRPGVICTKFPGEAGPCNKKRGRPEPSKCQSSCDYRLEEAFLREDIDGSIADSVAAYEQATADNENLTKAHWAAQIRAHVGRMPDLREKWMRHPTVSGLMNTP